MCPLGGCGGVLCTICMSDTCALYNTYQYQTWTVLPQVRFCPFSTRTDRAEGVGMPFPLTRSHACLHACLPPPALLLSFMPCVFSTRIVGVLSTEGRRSETTRVWLCVCVRYGWMLPSAFVRVRFVHGCFSCVFLYCFFFFLFCFVLFL